MQETKLGEITLDLQSWLNGNQAAGIRVFENTYQRLIAVANLQRDKVGDLTITPTEVVHEAYSRLVDAIQTGKPKTSLDLYRLSAHVFRLTCIDYLRAKLADKRDVRLAHSDQTEQSAEDVNMLHILMLIEEFETKFARQATIFQLTKVMGFSIEETAKLTNNSKATISRDLNFAKHWLASKLV